jgi:hypothetical protein
VTRDGQRVVFIRRTRIGSVGGDIAVVGADGRVQELSTASVSSSARQGNEARGASTRLKTYNIAGCNSLAMFDHWRVRAT